MITASFNSGAGKVELSINSTHESVASIANIGSLNYSFDQTPDTLSIDRVQALYTYINVDLLQYDDGGFDLWSVLIDETNEGQLLVEMAVELPGGAFQFFFKLRKSDIKINEKTGIVTLRLTPFTNLTSRMGQFFDGLYSKGVTNIPFRTNSVNEQGATTQFNYRSFSPKDFISHALNEIFGNSFNSTIASSFNNLGDGFSSRVFDDFTFAKKQLVICDIRTEGGVSGVSLVAPGDPDDNLEIGEGEIGSLGLPSQFLDISIPQQAGVRPGDVIYYGDGAPFFAGRKIGTVIEFIGGFTNLYRIQQDPEDLVPVPFGSYPYKIARGKKPQNFLLIDVLKEMAGVEGSVFGTGFSKNWYINRLAIEEQGSENLVTLNFNELIEFNPFNFDLSLGRSVVGQLADYRAIGDNLFGQWGLKVPITTDEDTNPQTGSGVPNIGSFSSITAGNQGASKGIDIKLAPAYPFLNKGFSTTSFILGNQTSVLNDLSFESALTRNGLKSYFQSLNSTKDSIAVEFTLLNAVRVLPYQLFQFDSRAPERYRDKQFRITQVSYNFVNNTCKIKGYQISAVTTPVVDDPRPVVPPPRVTPPFVGDPIGRLVVGVNDETVTSLRINLYQRLKSGQSALVLNEPERERDFFKDSDAGKYEFVVNNVSGEKVKILTGIKDVPIQSQRIDAPEGSFIYTSTPYDFEDDNDTDDKINELDEEFEERMGDLNTNLEQLEIDLEDLDEALEELNDVTLPQLEQDLSDNAAAINTLNTVTLPALQQELDDVLPITETKISNDAISSPKIQANAITAGKILAGAIVAGKIATDAVTTNTIAAGAIVAAKISAGAVIAEKIATDAVTANKIQAGAVITNKLSAKAVTAAKIDVDDLAANSAFISELMAQNLTITSSGKITNTGGTFEVDVNGFSTSSTGGVFQPSSSYKLRHDESSFAGNLAGVLSAMSDSVKRITLSSQGGFSTRISSSQNVELSAGNSIRILGSNPQINFLGTLPTSPPSGLLGLVYTQTASQLGGSGSTKVLCIT